MSTPPSTGPDQGRPGGDHNQELQTEQAYLDRAGEFLQAMRARADRGSAVAEMMVEAENTADARVVHYHLERRRQALANESGPLSFGRIDTDEAERWYIGRRHIEDDKANPVIVDWRAEVAAPFYRATAADPYGLVFRRRFSMEGSTLLALFDEDLEDPESMVGGGIPDPLLAELQRSRTGQMADIVATIAAEQDEIIRAPLGELLVVQGGPGTGKTAVGLHRAAFLLFTHRMELASGGPGAIGDSGVLVLGPNPLFLRYISEVLPSLGEVSVRQATLSSLVASRYRVRGRESRELAAVKGRAVMASVMLSAVRSVIKVPSDGLELRSGLALIRFGPDELTDIIKSTLASGIAQNDGREVFRRRLIAEAWRRHSARLDVDPGSEPVFTGQLRSDKTNQAAIARIWPTVSAGELLKRLYSSPRFLARSADGLLDADERALLARKSPPKGQPDPWTEADICLLDETESLSAGQTAVYGHIVVDEAQDLSPMALRMVGRRSAHGSMTILGDLAQATAPNATANWQDAVEILVQTIGARPDRRPEVHIAELTVGYRVPASIVELANRLLPEAAPGVTPVVAVREGGEPPLIVEAATAEELGPLAAGETAQLRQRGLSVAVIALEQYHRSVIDALGAGRQPWTSSTLGSSSAGPTGGLPGHEAVAVLTPGESKGLEFDAVVVVEPADIATSRSGLRHLYVSMTRAVQHLGLIHHQPLPVALRDHGR